MEGSQIWLIPPPGKEEGGVCDDDGGKEKMLSTEAGQRMESSNTEKYQEYIASFTRNILPDDRVRGKNGGNMPGKNSGYHPGIPQSEPFTKWDTDKDEVEVDYKRMDGGRQGAWFSGPKGIILKILLVIVIFSLGLIIGYVLRRSVHEIFHSGAKCAYTDGYEGYNAALSAEVQKFISADSLSHNIQEYTARDHMTGTHNNNILGKRLKEQMSQFGLTVKESKYNVLLSYANWEKPNTVYLINDTGSVVYQTMYEGPEEDEHPELTQPYNAYAHNATVQGDLVYANFGEEHDFMELEDKNVSCKGKIVIMRYGRIFRGIKVRNAEIRGAIGVLLYSDPEQVTRPGQGVYPDTIYLPKWAAQVGYVSVLNGDPLTPGVPSIDGVPRADVADVDLPRIPVQPIGYEDAATFMADMGGPGSTDPFHGKLDSEVTYNLGPGYKAPDEKLQVKLEVNNQRTKRDITNIFGILEGTEEPDRYVIVGCHYDAWTFGAMDPNTGTAIMMEIIKALTSMVKEGWQPRRTIIFAHWDAEEQGMIGSFEWVEEHAKELSQRTVAYLNLDGPIRGNRSMKVHASPLLRHLAINASRTVPSPVNPEGATLFDLWKGSGIDPLDETLPQVLDMQLNTDTAPFQNLLGVPCFWPRFYKDGMDHIPAYHTPMDTYAHLVRFIDPHFLATEAMTRFATEIVVQLSSSTKIPFDARELAQSLEVEFDELRATLSTDLAMKNLNKLDRLQWAVGNFSVVAGEFHQRFVEDDVARVLDTRRYNDKVMQVSRAFIRPEGLPGRPNMKNILSAPTSDGVDTTFTGIPIAFQAYSRSPSKELWDVVEQQIAIAMLSVQSAARILSEDLFSRGAPPTGL